MIKKHIVLISLFGIFSSASFAQSASDGYPPLNPESCTSIMVGKNASADGSVITSHTCDSNYRTWVDVVAAMTYDRDTTTTIWSGRMHTEYVEGRRGMEVKGTIPEVSSTYRFLDTSYPCLNEVQLGMGETTITGRRALVNKNGMFMIEELQRIALQRCSTARQAITLMGELIEKYGYGDWGECLTIADKNEVWHFEVFGEGPDKIGGVWAAVRIPDDHVGVSANIPRISTIDLKDKDNCMASKNVFEVAKKMGFWDGKKPFRFWEAYGGPNYSGKLKSFSIREYFILNKLAPSLNLSYDAEELPLSVKPENKVSVTDVMALLSETYEGTEYDPLKNLKVEIKDRTTGKTDSITSPAAHPWMNSDLKKLINTVKPGTIENNRLVAVPQCAYSTVIQLRNWLPDAVGGIVWLSLDNPAQSPRIPVFCGTTDLPACFDICGQHHYREDSALWSFRRANKLATIRWGATKEMFEKAINHFTEKGQTELPFVEKRYMKILEKDGEEKALEFLTGYTSDFAGAAIQKWEEMGDDIFCTYGRSF